MLKDFIFLGPLMVFPDDPHYTEILRLVKAYRELKDEYDELEVSHQALKEEIHELTADQPKTKPPTGGEERK